MSVGSFFIIGAVDYIYIRCADSAQKMPHLLTWIILKAVERDSIFRLAQPAVDRSDNDTPFSCTSWVDCGEPVGEPEGLPTFTSINDDVLHMSVTEMLHGSI